MASFRGKNMLSIGSIFFPLIADLYKTCDFLYFETYSIVQNTQMNDCSQIKRFKRV